MQSGMTRWLTILRSMTTGADLKAAPFQSAASLKTLSAYTDVVILIVTPHWLGVETPEGQRGWLPQERLEHGRCRLQVRDDPIPQRMDDIDALRFLAGERISRPADRGGLPGRPVYRDR